MYYYYHKKCFFSYITVILGLEDGIRFPQIESSHKQLRMGIWLTVAFAALFCNILIIHVVRANSHMHTTTNYLIANMAFCDIIGIALTTGGTVSVLESGWIWKGDAFRGNIGLILCTVVHHLMYIISFCSIYSLVMITFDRFLAVTRPLKYQNRASWTKYVIPGIWLVSIAIPANYSINKMVICEIDNTSFCFGAKSPTDAIFFMVFSIAIPHVVMVIFYIVIAYKLCTRRVPGEHTQETNGQTAAQKVARKVTLMIIFILVAFEITWFPVFIQQNFKYIHHQPGTFDEDIFFASSVLMISNGIFNSLIYAIFNENFRNAFLETLRWRFIKSTMQNIHININLYPHGN